jgi:DNA-binding transcriptional MerR regulator
MGPEVVAMRDGQDPGPVVGDPGPRGAAEGRRSSAGPTAPGGGRRVGRAGAGAGAGSGAAARDDTPHPARGVYGISVASELVGMPAQNLRLYEARGLVEPARTEGGTRRYSADDLERLRRIGELLGAGLNLAGVGMVLQLEDENARLRAEQAALQWQSTETRRRRRPPRPPAGEG